MQEQPGDLNYGAMAALALSSAVITMLVGDGGLAVGALPDLDLLFFFRSAEEWSLREGSLTRQSIRRGWGGGDGCVCVLTQRLMRAEPWPDARAAAPVPSPTSRLDPAGTCPMCSTW